MNIGGNGRRMMKGSRNRERERENNGESDREKAKRKEKKRTGERRRLVNVQYPGTVSNLQKTKTRI